MGTTVNSSEASPLPVTADVVGGSVAAVLGLVHVFGLQLGGLVGFAALLFGWPLVGGSVASRLSSRREDAAVDGAVSGTFGALFVTALVFVTGLAGAWPGFVVRNVGVSLWPVTFALLAMLTISWTVFGYVGGYAATLSE